MSGVRCTICGVRNASCEAREAHMRRAHGGNGHAPKRAEIVRVREPEHRLNGGARQIMRAEPEPSRGLAQRSGIASLSELSERAQLKARYHRVKSLEAIIEEGRVSQEQHRQFEYEKAEYIVLHNSISERNEREYDSFAQIQRGEKLTAENTRLLAENAALKAQAQPGLLTRLLNPKPNDNGHAPAEPPANFFPQAEANWRREEWQQRWTEARRQRFIASGYL